MSARAAKGKEAAEGRRTPSAVSLSAVHKSYRVGEENVEVLKGVDLEVAEGEMVALRGISGAGKSTLLNLIGGIDRADSGRIRVCGVALDNMNGRAATRFRREKIGILYQFHNLLPSLSALENVFVALEARRRVGPAERERARGMLDAVGLADKAGKFPRSLSGGEQQRVALARALVGRPPLVLADEPTGNLDEARGDEVLALLQQLRRQYGTTVMVATHSPRVAGAADRTLEIRDGRIGAPAQGKRAAVRRRR